MGTSPMKKRLSPEACWSPGGSFELVSCTRKKVRKSKLRSRGGISVITYKRAKEDEKSLESRFSLQHFSEN